MITHYPTTAHCFSRRAEQACMGVNALRLCAAQQLLLLLRSCAALYTLLSIVLQAYATYNVLCIAVQLLTSTV
jgi:hypothetical protein